MPQFNQTRRSQSVLVRLEEQGQLLNPVWGLRTAGGNGTLTIGALDPNEYEGEINWVPALDGQPIIHVDAFKGYKGNILPLDYPINATIDNCECRVLSDLSSAYYLYKLHSEQEHLLARP